MSTKDRKNVSDAIMMYRTGESFVKTKTYPWLVRIVLEARIYGSRIHTLESPNFVKYIKGCLCATTATRQRYSGPFSAPSPAATTLVSFVPFSNHREPSRAGRNATRSFVFVCCVFPMSVGAREMRPAEVSFPL